RVLNPAINIPIVSIATTLPGASPDDIESLVTVPIEDSVNALPDIKTVTSSSQDSVSIVSIEFEAGIDPDKAKTDVQSAVDSVTDLPENAETPLVQKLDFENEPIWTFTLSTMSDNASLVRFGKLLRDRLENAPTIDRVETTGLDDEEIQVLISPEKLTAFGLDPLTISQSIRAGTGSFPAGSISTGTSSFVLSIDPTVTTIEELRDIKITVGTNTVSLADIATIQQRTKPDASTSYIATQTQAPRETIRFDIYKTSSANITDAVKAANEITDDVTAEYQNTFTISSILNSGEEVDEQYYELLRDLLITVSLVFLTLFLFLGLRQAIIASLAIPLTFLITFTVMSATDISLSFIAFFSLLLSLGLLVDDTIVVISALTAYYRTGKFTPLEAGLLVWRDFRTAIITTTLTTVWAFVPLLLSTGIIGEFIRPIPIVVSTTLLASLGVALFITLPFFIILLNSKVPYRVTLLFRVLGVALILTLFVTIMPQGPLYVFALILFCINIIIYFYVRYSLYMRSRARIAGNERVKSESKFSGYINNGVINFDGVERRYRAIIDAILSKPINRRKTVIAVVLFSIFSYLLVPLGLVKSEFFPKSDQEYIYLSLELPSGSNIERTKTEMLTILEDTRRLENTKFVTGSLRLSIDPSSGFAGSGDNTALITLLLPPEGARDISSIALSEQLRKKYSQYQNGKVSIVEISDGPPAGSDLQIKLTGEDLAVLDANADKIQQYLAGQSGVTNISKSIKAGTSKVVFIPDNQKMLAAGVTQEQMGLWLRTYASGFTLQEDAKLQSGTDDSQDIVLRTASVPQTAADIATISVTTQTGSVPLISLGRFELRPNPTLITREEGKRTLSVTASTTQGASATELNTELESFADTLNLPEGYAWATGGLNEENDRSVQAILMAMLLSFLLIIITMVLQFSSFRKAFIVMLVIPLSISGVFIVFAMTNTPLSFPALIGILALFGIVVKNSILIVDKINQNLKQDMYLKEAVVDAAGSRLEPITLTSFATIVGLIPITLSDPLWRGLGGAIMSGLFFSGTMMLFFIPVVYYIFFQNSEGKEELVKNK
nr:efflux RND transporter permease subunit [Candidatus Levybacteria bacterium]